MASVFLAEDERLGRLVAVKRLHGESTEEVAARFRREARLGAALNHPNVVAVYDIGSDDEGVLIVMEYVDGRTLGDEIKEGRMAPERAIAILRGVAGALDYAHENGVLHRDVKPANILIRRDGEVKLADLGIATAAEQSKITRSGAVLGTAAYMAPERLDGRPGGPAVDVYALTAVAFEMLSGRTAYEGNTPLEVAHKVVNEPAPDLRRLVPDAPVELAEVLKQGLAWEPAARPPSAGALVAAIEAALREPTAAATPARVLPPERVRTRDVREAAAADPVRTPARSRRPELPVIAAVLGVLALLAIVLLTAGGGEQRLAGLADGAGRVSKEQREERQPVAPAPQTPRGGTGDPAATVNDFYQRAASGDYGGAWALATPRAQAKLGGFESFSRGQSTLESISFPKLKGKEKGDAATVQLQSEAVHTNRVDRCNGSIDLVRQGGDWRLDDFHIANCKQSAR